MTDKEIIISLLCDEFGADVSFKIADLPVVAFELVNKWLDYSHDIDVFICNSPAFLAWINRSSVNLENEDHDLVIHLPSKITWCPNTIYETDDFHSYGTRTLKEKEELKKRLMEIHDDLTECFEKQKSWMKERERYRIMND